MMFEYQALNNKGSTVSDIIDAPSEMSAKQKLRSQGLYVVKLVKHDVIEKSDPTQKTGSLTRVLNNFSNYLSLKVSSKQVGLFSRQLSTLLNAGMSLPVAIAGIIDQIENPNFKRIIADIKEKLEEGSSFSNSLARHKSIFSEMYINMVRVGENLGSLDQVVERLADLEEKKNILKSKIQAALWYPSFLLLFATGVIFFLMIYIIPTLEKMILEMGKELPLPTVIVLGISNFLSHFWFIIVFGVIGGVAYLNYYAKTPAGKRKIDELKLKIPFIKTIYKKIVVLRFTQNLGILLNNNVDILKSFEIVKKIVVNSIIEEQIDAAAKMVKEGSSVSNALSKTEFLPKLVLGMISAGEASDKLDTMLLNIGNVYETELDLTVTSLTNMIEPVIIIIMGVAIGAIVMAVLLPIFEMNLMMQ